MKFWYQRKPTLLAWLLLPLSLIFAVLTALRRFVYRLLPTKRFTLPVIVIGNISIGGTGKTPLLMSIAHFLKQQGYRVGIVSRGYGGTQKQAYRVQKTDSAAKVGDEALMLAKQGDYPVVVARHRREAVAYLQKQGEVNVILSDDGLQHYAMHRDIEIAVIDAERRLGNGLLLPAGPLRETKKRLKQVDFVVVNGQPAQKNEFDMHMEVQGVTHLNSGKEVSLNELKQKSLLAIAGIGNPQRFFATLQSLGLSFKEKIFPDHHAYQQSDLNNKGCDAIIMTEKDAVKCSRFKDDRCYVLTIKAQCQPQFLQQLLIKLRSL